MFAILFCLLLNASQYVANDKARCKHWFDTHMSLTKDFEYYRRNVVRIKFRTTDELKINCSGVVKPLPDKKVFMLSLYPEKSERTLFSYDIDLKQIVSSFNFLTDRTIAFYNLHGFNPTYKYKNNQVDTLLVFNSKFDFYLNKTTRITSEFCVHSNFYHSSVFTALSLLYVKYTAYSTPVCPYVFSDSKLDTIWFTDIINSHIYRNELVFMNKSESVLSVRYLITLRLEATYIHLTNSLIHPQLFRNVESIIICCYIYSIDQHLLDSFTSLKSIVLDMDTFDLNLSIGFKWLLSLNKDINVTDKKIVTSGERRRAIYYYFSENSIAFQKYYSYPDEDLCFFLEFPLQRLVYPVITSQSTIRIECTCTVIWLLQYTKYVMTPNFSNFYEKVNTENFSVQHCLQGGAKYISSRIRECNFAEKFGKCFEKKRSFHVNDLSLASLLFDYKWLQYVVVVCIQPILCIVSLSTNLLTISVIWSKKAADIRWSAQNSMYKHIVANSWFNVLYSSIKLFSLVNICIYPRTSFCSSIYETEMSQYFKIYVIYFLGNAARLCTNISYIAFSMSRYFLSTSNPSHFFELFGHLKLRRFYAIVSLFALSLSLYKIFQFKVNDFIPTYDLSFPFDAYGVNYCHYYIRGQIPKWNTIAGFKCNMFNTLTMVNNILNNMVFFFISIIIDVGLIRFTNQNLTLKRKLFTSADSPALVQAVKMKEHINRMVITNGLLYFVSHVPEFVVILLLLVYKKSMSIYCASYFSCIEFVEIAQVFNFCSIGLQFFVFKHFDKNFRECLGKLLRRSAAVKN